MKKIFTLVTGILSILTVWSQAPEKISYQAIIRNTDNKLVTNQNISVQISILQNSAAGTSVYTETHKPATNSNGLVTLEIGSGTTSDNFSNIDWADGPYFIKTETDPAGGTNYTITGTSQLLSVPFALHAKTAETITETDPVYRASVASGITATDTTNWNNKQDKLMAGTGISIVGNTISTTGGSSSHYVGELYGGGVVFWVDHTGQHGLIMSMVDLSTSQAWSNITDVAVGTNDWDGAGNTTAIIGQSGHTSSAAKICTDYINTEYGTGIFNDWYLPSIAQLNHVWNNFYEVQKALTIDGNAATTPLVHSYYYWSSSEGSTIGARAISFYFGNISNYSKSSTYHVRAVRAF